MDGLGRGQSGDCLALDGLLSRTQAAKHLGICLRNFDRIARQRELATVKVGKRKIMVTSTDLADYVKRQRVAPIVAQQA